MPRRRQMGGSKRCGACKEVKPVTEFYCSGDNSYESHCKLCSNLRTRVWYENNKRYAKSYRMKYVFNLTDIEWAELFNTQNCACALCETKETTRWCTDHSHKTDKVRGILCHSCNLNLGGYERIVNNPKLKNYLTE